MTLESLFSGTRGLKETTQWAIKQDPDVGKHINPEGKGLIFCGGFKYKKEKGR